MSKITLFDPNCYKFTTDLINYWRDQGHEVREEFYYNPELVRWADIIWFETCDNNLHQATRGAAEGSKLSDIDMTGKKIICRVIDIEAWCGLHKNVDWQYVNDVIFIAPHIQELVEKDIQFTNTKVHLIPPGVNTDKFTFRQNPIKNKNIAWVAHRWDAKGIDYFLQYAAMLYKLDPEYKIYALGIWSPGLQDGWYRRYINYFLQWNTLNVEFIDHIDDMNEFLEDKSYAILFSKKEAFSYAIAEGMAKGLKPIIHNFYGADKIWNEKYIWNTLDEALGMTFSNQYNPQEYCQYIEENYSLNQMLSKFDEILK